MMKTKKYKYYKLVFNIIWKNLSIKNDIIEKFSNRYNINPSLLKSIIVIEQMNRGHLLYKFVEKFLSIYLKNILVKMDLSIGYCQIKITTAQKMCRKIKKELLIKFLVNENINIHICARLLASLKNKTIDETIIYYNAGTFDKNIIDQSLIFYLDLCKHGLSKKI